jgi:hypothetical protein
MKGIYFSNGRYGIRWWDPSQKKMVHGGRFGTKEEAEAALLARTTSYAESPVIRGVSASKYDPEAARQLWDLAAGQFEQVRAIEEEKKTQSIYLGDMPTGIAFLSDLHLGNSGTDYAAIMADTELIADTPGMYAAFHGDGIDNWIVGKLQALQRGQAVSHQSEVMMFRYWLEKIHHKLLLVVSGNHDNWTAKIAGLDIIPTLLGDTHVLYDSYQVRVNLQCGDASWDTVVRHQWKYSSIFNPTHGIEVGYDRMGVPFDIGIGGHTHIGTLFRPFYRHHKEKLALLTGAYKRVDSFAKEIGYAPTMSNGCGAIIFMPDGKLWYNTDLKVASDYLKYLRSQYVRGE